MPDIRCSLVERTADSGWREGRRWDKQQEFRVRKGAFFQEIVDSTKSEDIICEEATARRRNTMWWKMADAKYKYDVAFSFLQQDEALAIQINDLLQGRMSTFLYTERQKEISGKDGEKEFNRVFGTESRIVVVFYRKNWGQTKWTRIEETAIRNRAFEEGYDFTTFIPVEAGSRVPKWLPKTRLWVGFDRWGADGAATVIEARVQEAGGTPREESVEDHATRISREIANNEGRIQFLRSDKGAKAAREEVKSVFSELSKTCEAVTNGDAHIEFKIKQENDESFIFSSGLTLAHCWKQTYFNTLDESKFHVTIWRGMVGFPNVFRMKRPTRLHEFILNFDITSTNQYGWRESSGKNRFLSSAKLAEFSMKMFLDSIRDVQIGTER